MPRHCGWLMIGSDRMHQIARAGGKTVGASQPLISTAKNQTVGGILYVLL